MISILILAGGACQVFVVEEALCAAPAPAFAQENSILVDSLTAAPGSGPELAAAQAAAAVSMNEQVSWIVAVPKLGVSCSSACHSGRKDRTGTLQLLWDD